MDVKLWTFVLYVAVVLSTTVSIGHALYRKGDAFLKSIFSHSKAFVKPVNTLLLIGFYLVNLGVSLYYFNEEIRLDTPVQALSFVLVKLGGIYLLLGVMHLINVSLFIYLEKKFNL